MVVEARSVVSFVAVSACAAAVSFVAGAHARWAPPTDLRATVTAHESHAAADEHASRAWASFKRKHGRRFRTSAEELRRFHYFEATLKRLAAYEAEAGVAASSVFGVTEFADWSDDEKRARLGFAPPTAEAAAAAERTATVWSAGVNASDYPYWRRASRPFVDWRRAGVVTPVKNQGQCGSCWAFSATSQIESDWAVAGNALVEFSPQQVIACDTQVDGCGGGWPYSAYQYLMTGNATAGLANAWAWPYEQSMLPEDTCLDPNCTQKCTMRDLAQIVTHTFAAGDVATVDGWGYVIERCESGSCDDQPLGELMHYVETRGPASICVNAQRWFDYQSGVLSSVACGGHKAGNLDHCVQVVGYNASAAQPYWIVRNQWDTIWGHDGYIFLEMSDNNTCGIGNMVTYVDVRPPEAGFQNHTTTEVPLN